MKAAARHPRDEQIAAAYRSRQSLRYVGRLFGLSHEGVRKVLIQQGVEMAPVGTWSMAA